MNSNIVRFGVAAAVVLAIFLGIRFIGPEHRRAWTDGDAVSHGLAQAPATPRIQPGGGDLSGDSVCRSG